VTVPVSASVPRSGLAALDELDAVLVPVADEADARSALAHAVRRALGLDPVLRGERRERRVEVVDAYGDMAVSRAEVVRAPVVVVRQLEDVLLVADREE
jgi:hypothetical protein